MTLDDVSSYVLWVVFGLLAIISVIFLTGHGVSLIAGYNTASKEEIEKYNAKKLCHCMGIGMSVITILVGIMAINKRLLQNNYFVFIFVALVLIDVVVTIVVSNKFCKENSKYK